ncbi:MAG: hypothetical protein JRJ82_18210 [Deltaproteobacteria bacterium]|nr:hypothetical protein [Deltaproteobacteria bacterium]
MPACVHHCPTEALIFGDPKNLSARLQKRRAESMANHAVSGIAGAGES